MKKAKYRYLVFFSGLVMLGPAIWMAKSFDFVANVGKTSSVGKTSDSESKKVSSEQPDVTHELIGDSQQTNAESSFTSDPRLEFTSQFMKAKNAQQAQAVIDDIRNSGDRALASDLEFEIRGRCGFLDGFEPPFERTRWAHDLILKYCSSYTSRINDSGGVPMSMTRSLAFTNLRNKLLELETAEFDRYFMEFLANTNSVQELRAAEFVAKDLQASGAPLSFGMTDDRLVTPPEAEKALDIAFELYGCVRFGGCDQNDFKVLEYCVLTGNCERGWNMFDIYSYTLAPNVYEQVTNVLNNMIQAGKSDS